MPTNYEKHFSSPKKIARLIAHADCRFVNGRYDQVAHMSKCNGCPLLGIGGCSDEKRIFEWLQEECDD